MPERSNVNDSLNDMSSEGFEFNESLSQDESRRSEIIDPKKESDALKLTRQGSSNPAELDKQTEAINSKNLESNTNLQTASTNANTSDSSNNNSLRNNRSLFDKDALIDYARYEQNGDSWTNYNNEGGNNKHFVLNNTNPINVPVINRGIDENDLTVKNLVTWSELNPALQLKFQDFVYCKNLGIYPNNRLIVLRRFINGVPDNLFDYYDTQDSNSKLEYCEPISTMITWLKPDESPMDLQFKEVWSDNNNGVLEILSDIASKGGNIGKAIASVINGQNKDKSNIATDALSSAILDFTGSVGSKLDGNTFLGRSPAGNPNLILNSKKRETGGSGISSDINFDLTFDYEMRFINNVDPGIAMLDLLSNCLRMGTSVSEFRFNVAGLGDRAARNLLNGNFVVATKKFSKDILKFAGETTDKFKEFINNFAGVSLSDIVDKSKDAGKSVLSSTFDHVISRYREELKAAIYADTGLESGIWHVTIGNPKNPMISCGDLVINRSRLTLGKELGYNDFPNSFSVNYNFVSARQRGRDEIERIFNAGRGRVYVYQNIGLNPDYNKYKLDPTPQSETNDNKTK